MIKCFAGGMQATVRFQIEHLGFEGLHDGDVILCNHPKAGGSHLPDLTVITPVCVFSNVIPFKPLHTLTLLLFRQQTCSFAVVKYAASGTTLIAFGFFEACSWRSDFLEKSYESTQNNRQYVYISLSICPAIFNSETMVAKAVTFYIYNVDDEQI